MQEIWKDIPGYEGLYKASNLGRIKRLQKYNKGRRGTKRLIQEKILTGSVKLTGYIEYVLTKNHIHKYCLGHRLIGLSFLDNKYNKPDINHKNGIKIDNRLENLEWVTKSENMLHSYNVLGQKPAHTGKFGKLNHKSKEVNQYTLDGTIIKTWANAYEIYRYLNIRASTIWACCNGKQTKSHGFKWKYNIL